MLHFLLCGPLKYICISIGKCYSQSLDKAVKVCANTDTPACPKINSMSVCLSYLSIMVIYHLILRHLTASCDPVFACRHTCICMYKQFCYIYMNHRQMTKNKGGVYVKKKRKLL